MRLESKLTLFCLVIFLLGGLMAWVIVMQGGPEALGAIIPLTFIGGVHLFLGPVAVYRAYTLSNPASPYIYGYFILHLVLAFWLMNLEGLIYYLLYITFMLFPIVLVTVLALYKRRG